MGRGITNMARSCARSLGCAAVLACGLGVAAAGCGDGSETSTDPVLEPSWPLLQCDPIAPSYCAFPFPSNVFTVPDDRTPTGRRLNLPDAVIPIDTSDRRALSDPWNELDGFSTGLPLMTQFPGVTLASLANVADARHISRSLDPDSPTVVLDTQTGERVPHWVDLDMTGKKDDARTFMIRPAIRLADARRYIIAIRGIEDAGGSAIAPSEGFAALRDDTKSDDPAILDRRELYRNIFEALEEAEIARNDLQIAWDFTTASRENNTAAMVHMRDEALAMFEGGGPAFEITSIDEDFAPEHVAFRIFGLMTVPLYLDQPEPQARLIRGADGLPDPNPDQPTAQFEVEILIPHAARETPAALMQYGHGLLGDKTQIESSHFLEFIDAYNYVLFAVDFVGFADEDQIPLAAILDGGRFHDFSTVIDRQHQGMLNSLLAMRMMKTTFAAHPEYGPLVDPGAAYYHGISQGGIFGGTYMALTTDVERGVLGVPGMPYNLLLPRSVDFDPFFGIIRPNFPDARDQMFILALAQMLWDRTEPNGYVPYITDDPLPNTPTHQVLMRAAIGDHQVTNLGAHVMARAMGVQHVDTGLQDVFGLETVAPPHEGSGLVEYDFGLPPDPVENLPQRECEDPHGKLRKLDEARQQLDLFLRTGVIDSFCAGGVCSFADMSGC